MKTIYLCGAINGCTDSQCKDWREYTKQKLDGKYNFLDPMRRDFRGKEAESVNQIVHGDYTDIDNSNILLANANTPSWGTAMEIHYAFTRNSHFEDIADQMGYSLTERMLTVVLISNQEKISPWLKYHSHKIFKTLDEAIWDYLSNIK